MKNGHQYMRVVKVRMDKEEHSLRLKSKFSDFGQVWENEGVVNVGRVREGDPLVNLQHCSVGW